MCTTCPDSPNTRTRAHGGTKETAFGRLHKWGRSSAAPLCGFLYMGFWAQVCVFGSSGQVLHTFITVMCDFAYGFPHGYMPEPIELPLGTIAWLCLASVRRSGSF